jgi:hypothetical protein
MADERSFPQSENSPRETLDDARDAAQETVAKLDDLRGVLDREVMEPVHPSSGSHSPFDEGRPFDSGAVGSGTPLQNIEIGKQDTGNEQGGPIDATSP